MTRLFLTIVVPLIAPGVAFLLWRAAAGRAPFGATWAMSWPWLLGAGVALTAATLVVVNVQFGAGPHGTYVPPRVIGGQVQPGHIAPAP